MKYDFTDMAIRFETYEQLQHLAQLAEDSGLVVDDLVATSTFKYFCISANGSFYSNFLNAEPTETIVSYSDFISNNNTKK